MRSNNHFFSCVVIFWLLIILFPVYPAFSQNLAMHVYSIEDGLKYPQVLTVYQDSKRLIWVGTSYGVGRYDGRKFINLTKANGLPHDSVYQVLEDPTGKMWVITQTGLALIDPDKLDNPDQCIVPIPEQLSSLGSETVPLADRSNDDIWFADDNFIFHVKHGQIDTISLKGIFTGEKILSFVVTDEGVPLICTKNALMAFVDKKWVDIAVQQGEQGANISLAKTSNGLYLLQENGVYKYEGDVFVSDPKWRFPKGYDLFEMLFLSDSIVLLTHSDGIWLLSQHSAPLHFTSENGLPSNDINGGIVDRDGVIWLATEYGLAKIYNFSLLTYPEDPPTVGAYVFAFESDDQGGTWIGHSSGISYVKDKKIQNTPFKKLHLEDGVWALLSIPNDGVLAGTPNGLIYFNEGKLQKFSDLHIIGNSNIYDLLRAKDGLIWVSALDGLASFRWDLKTHRPVSVRTFTTSEGLPFNETRTIDEDEKGSIWIGTDGGGLVQWDGRAFHTFGKENGLSSLVCRAVLTRPDGIWIGTDIGLFLLQNGRITPMKQINDALDDLYIVSMINGHDGAVWLANPYKIFEIRNKKVVRSFGKMHGLAGSMTTMENCLYVDPTDRLWIGMTGGFSTFDLAADRKLIPEPSVFIEKVLDKNGDKISSGMSIPYKLNDITFYFTSPTYVAEDLTQFQQLLKGHDIEWSAPKKENQRNFAHLLPGKYKMNVKAISASGQVSPKPATFSFLIAKPWWQTNIFKLFVVIALSAGIYSGYRLRTYQLLQHEKALERLVKERTKQLESANGQLDAANRELARLANQDGLTCLANKRFFTVILDEEWKRAIRETTPFSIIMIDVDHFKLYNDNYGHQAGDACLKMIADTLKSFIKRPADLVARYGGEEFIGMLPSTERKGAEIIAELIRKKIDELNIPHHFSQTADHITISLGVAVSIPTRGSKSESLIEKADKMLYLAKNNGRNQVRIDAGS